MLMRGGAGGGHMTTFAVQLYAKSCNITTTDVRKDEYKVAQYPKTSEAQHEHVCNVRDHEHMCVRVYACTRKTLWVAK